MSIADPVSPAFALVYSTLHGDATLMALISGVYQGMAPPEATFPYAVITYQSGVDTLTANAIRILSRLILQVKIVGLASDGARIRAAFAQADALLMPNGRPLVEQGGTLSLYRTGTVSYDEVDGGGTLYTNLGGLFRVEV